jgi:diketogulonate reductase-like aldo/keto reductase
MVNQIHFFIGHTQEKLTLFCQQNGVLVEGYSPLATGAITSNQKLGKIAEKYKSTIPQLCIRYILQKQVIPLPKSTNPEHIQNNLNLDFEITVQDMEYLDKLTGTIKGLILSRIKRDVKNILLRWKR